MDRRRAPWFEQAASDARTAHALRAMPAPMLVHDVACHVAAMCAQAIEKSLKGYVVLNHAEPAMDHRPDGYLAAFLTGEPLLHYADHRSHLSKLFDPNTRGTIKQLLDLTPGGLGNRTDIANTEYPWTNGARWAYAPAVASFGDTPTMKVWLDAASRVSGTLHKLWIAVDRATAI